LVPTQEKYVKEQKAAVKQELNDIAALIKEGTIFKRVRAMSALFDILQTHQRLCEIENANLSDGAYHMCEMLARVADFKKGRKIISGANLETVKQAILFRFKKLYTPNYALAIMLDPRRKFSDAGCEALIAAGYNIRADARFCLEKRILVLSAPLRVSIMAGYNRLVAGQVFTQVRDADKFAAADNMPLSDWYVTYRTEIIEDLSVYIAEPLCKLSLCQAGTERLNSAAKFIQEGRLSLLSENSRMLCAIYVNGRLLDEYYKNLGVEKEPGFYRLGRHWPPRDAADVEVISHVLDDAEAEGDLEAERHVLRDAVALLEADDAEAALLLAQTPGGISKPCTTTKKRKPAPPAAADEEDEAEADAAPKKKKKKNVSFVLSDSEEDADAPEMVESDSDEDADAPEDDGSDSE
jgi:hypothetical protein